MRSTIRALLFLLATAMVAVVVDAQTRSPVPACRPPEHVAPKGYPDLVLDARDGLPEGGQRRRSGLKHEVRVLVINENPFLYDYDLKVDEETLDDGGAIDGFLGNGFFAGLGELLKGAKAPEVTQPAQAEDGQGGQRGLSGGPAAGLVPESARKRCSGVGSTSFTEWRGVLDRGWDFLRQVARESEDVKKQLGETVGELKDASEAYEAAKPSLSDPTIVCEELRAAATNLRSKLSALPDSTVLDPLEKAQAQLETKAKMAAVWAAESKTTLAANRKMHGLPAFPKSSTTKLRPSERRARSSPSR